uniref:RRM domain-containing protein n=1 Tax=Daucus carota subsp. sativus TaxID=79200 RepID=A0A175YH73_DAUCS
MAGRRSDNGETGGSEAIPSKEEKWRNIVRKARVDRQSITEDEVQELRDKVLKFWFLLDFDLLEAIQKGDVRWVDISMARVEYLNKVVDQELVRKCLEGDEEALCQTHRFLMNEGWWERANNLDLSKTIWRRDKKWEAKMEEQERKLRDYVISRQELVHPNVVKMVLQGDREGLRMALNHVHYNSLREHRVVKNMKAVLTRDKKDSGVQSNEEGKSGKDREKSYKNVLVENGEKKRWVRKERQILGNKEDVSQGRNQKNSMVFVHNLPEKSNSLEIWNFMRKWGRVLDCITPMRRDKFGKRFGFIRLQSIIEAEKFIRGVNGKLLAGNAIRAQFAQKQVSQVIDKKGRKEFKQTRIELVDQRREREPLHCISDKAERKIMGTVKLEVADHILSSEIERSLVVSSWKESSIVEILNTIEALGYEGVPVRSLSSTKFLVTFPSSDSFLNLDQDLFGLGFLDCKPVSVDDLILPRRLVLECLGLPITLWKFSNFAKILEGIGNITAISRLLDENLTYRNPMIEVETKEMSEINRELAVEFEGKQIVVMLKEVDKIGIEDNIMEELREMELNNVHREVEDQNISSSDDSESGSLYNIEEKQDKEVEISKQELVSKDKETKGEQTLGNETVSDSEEYRQVTSGKDNYIGKDIVPLNEKDIDKPQSSLEAREEVLVVQETQEELVVQETQEELVVQETSEELVVKETSEELISSENSKSIWSVREVESSSIVSTQSLEVTSGMASSSVSGLEKVQTSSGSVKKAEESLLKLKMGRKRGRPPKRKSRKGRQPFALCSIGGQLKCQGGASEAEKIYESCLLMGLEGKVDRDEAIKRIANRLGDN